MLNRKTYIDKFSFTIKSHYFIRELPASGAREEEQTYPEDSIQGTSYPVPFSHHATDRGGAG